MSNKKGFDPLSSLFDLPDTAPAPAAGPPARGDDLPEPPHVRVTPPVVPAGPDPAQLAKMLARAAAAKAAASRPPPPPAATPLAKATKPAAAPTAPAAPTSRLMAAPPPRKSLSAADALRLANEDEARSKAAPPDAAVPPAGSAPMPSAPAIAPRIPSALPTTAASTTLTPAAGAYDPTDVISGIIQDCLPQVGAVYIAKAIVLDDRGVLTGLWRAHRARFLSTGDLAGATAVNAVLRAVASVGPGQLAVAHAVTDKSDWLVWVDLSSSSLIAAFKDARAWFGS